MFENMEDKHFESQTIKPSIRLRNDKESEDVHYSVFYEDIPIEFQDTALRELNETEENKRMGISNLRKFLKRKGISGVDDHILITVLRNCKYNIDKSEKKLIKYLQTLDMVTKWLQTADMKRIENVFNQRFVGFLPYRDKHGRVIFYTTPYDIDFELFNTEEAGFASFCMALYLLTYPLTTIAGVVYIAECKTPSLSKLYQIMIAYRKYALTFLTFPLRISRVHVINENFIISWSYKLLKPFLPSKLVQRIQFHGSDLQSLQNLYHPAILPDEFGGSLGHLNPKFFMDDILHFIKKLKNKNLFIE